MPAPSILVFAGSIRTGSFNARLAALAAKELARGQAEVTRISLVDYPMPLYDGDLETRSGPPENAVKLKRLFAAHHGVFIASRDRVFALGAASNGTLGGMRSLMALRQVLELGCGALVIPEQIAVREAASAFDDNDELKDERSAGLLKRVAMRLVELSRHFA